MSEFVKIYNRVIVKQNCKNCIKKKTYFNDI